ncbi:NUMOD1 domain-containing DNA-binding protein [Mariniflexile litorale]|uniref:NUMOD1 domain-containing DNA-binding protein n=1 Tax=Mariniflexile litorale TaxID=3045158 RepID=A0AAU7EJH2_9FLAO|nr:NUMOD1 domain-containing DNA-binding protein [Mariniflexile sp. KMM 9835]MDQ8211192.1 NUMOD1 domain-containing DNA-binding protein [Mariniflexile sp. KMM 9835]
MKKNKLKSAGIIYTVKCEITGEFYVGATTDSIHQRKIDHQERAKRGDKHPFAQAIATYGADAFTWKHTDTASTIDELARKEKEYIEKLDSKKQGYNADAGGGFKKTIYQYSIKDGSLVNTYHCLESAASAIGVYKNSIGNACIGQNKTCKGYYWSYNFCVPFNPDKDLRKKQVVQYSLSGKQLAIYESVAVASERTGISKTCISRVCRKERDKSGGFIWKYLS